ncbi:kinesin-domain-containing protein [Viridothelium virens]|uniref:Kinesin-like protein KIF22 n=1 Tax=Viridothelium virens TaxID=1048519 RepID=A0A6A6HHF6_VIRVR|nr:kinesin-domain-containing protein [Viridothelium virens]
MSVRVVARIRPLLKLEQEKDVIVTTSGSGEESPASPTVVRIPNPKNEAESFSFQFNSVYDQESTQQSIFDNEVSPTVKHLFNGFDVTIFAYGVTGTGKTHTMRGGKSLAERGVIPRLLSSIYRRTRKIEKDSAGQTRADVSMSYYEIYNDRVHDLFESPEKRTPSGLPIRDNNGKTVVVGLTERPCTTLKEFEQPYDQANVNRSTSATKLNAHSSRSHAILCVKISQTTGDQTRISTASAIDLAGSEDNRRTDNGKERMVESASINKSLFVLAQCVEAISKKQTRVPYRESKMTRILSLGQNNGLTVMILNLAPVRSYHLDTLSSLNFANRTKKIEVNEIENEPIFNHGTAAKQTAAVSGSSIQQRQPLRPLAVSHNVQSTKTDKPVKAFSVYSDKTKTIRPLATIANTGRKLESSKQALSESSNFQTTMRADKAMRPSNIARPPPPANPMLSKANIEALIDRRIEEQLAVQRHQDSAAPTKHVDEEFQRRLEKLERRIEEKEEMDDPKAEGLQYLLMAKQHTASGHDQSALKMYQLALPFFPQNRKLEHKIQKLEDKIKAKKAAHISPPKMTSENPVPAPMYAVPDTSESENAIIRKPTRHETCEDPDDDDYYEEPPKLSTYDSDPDAMHNAHRKSRQPVSKAKLPVFRDLSDAPDEPASPRTSTLLQIINTRDLKQIRSLKGVGAKRAAAIVDALCEMDAGSGSEEATTMSTITSLEQLEALKGVGRSTVEGMRLGLAS